jgi:ubiquinone/menaquinone biosynthesis C-methylase UbiE
MPVPKRSGLKRSVAGTLPEQKICFEATKMFDANGYRNRTPSLRWSSVLRIMLGVSWVQQQSISVFVACWGPAVSTAQYPSLPPTSLLATNTRPLKESTTTLSFDTNCPAQWENQLMDCDASVQFWSSFQGSTDDPWENLAQARSIVARHLRSRNSAESSYWISNVARSLYFITNAALGVVDQRIRSKPDNGSFLNGIPAASQTRLILEAVLCYEQEWPWIQAGRVPYPWDALVQPNRKWQWNHRHARLPFLLQQTMRAVRESRAIFQRRDTWRGQPSRPPSSFNQSSFPQYYLNDFHYQTDGWLSRESADNYEVATETLFLGRQDCMQRQSLLPMTAWKDAAAPASILEVACGTGRLSCFVRQQFPTAHVTLTDLSPFYLEKARDNDEYWRSFRERGDEQPVSAAQIVPANAEQLPFPDESFSIVSSVYLFHELPPVAQAAVAREMVRVLQPGGLICLTDSLQLGDRPSMDQRMSAFGQLNEPYFSQYIRANLPQLFVHDDNGMVCYQKYVRSNTKTLSFVKKK